MPNILLIGAPGYIGRSVLHTLSTSGLHTIFALARTPQQAQYLLASEAHPIHATISDHTAICEALTTHHISCIVDLSGTRSESKDLLNALIACIQKTGDEGVTVAGKLGYIYCSGTWVHGSSLETVNDLVPVGASSSPTPPADLVSWRADFEKDVLAAGNVLDVMIIRPALVYGRAGKIWDIYFEPLASHAARSREQSVEENRILELPVDPASRPGLIHVDDVASGLVGAGRGDDGKSMFERAMGTSFNGGAGRARSLLGWEPRRLGGFVGGMKEFVQAWEAARREG
ncbi:hypothetical protein ACMFMG_001028 [Clarireedia jacksonii]